MLADIAGKWQGTLRPPDGNEFPVIYVFKTDSGKLTGTVASPQMEVPITDGKLISATDFTFSVAVNGTAYKHTCKLYPDADSIGMDIDYEGAKMHATLKRSVEK